MAEYKEVENPEHFEVCNHDYEVLLNDLETVKTFSDNTIGTVRVTGCVVFYCRKCTDVQKKVID